MKTIGKREAMRAAIDNAAALIETMDLGQLYGNLYFEVGDCAAAEANLAEAQAKLVDRIRAFDRSSC